MQYRHLFFDLDHTLWDFETNSRETLLELFNTNNLGEKGVTSFEEFFNNYSAHNHRLWDRYTKGFIKQEELRWKRMWLALLDFKIADDILSRKLSVEFLQILPTKRNIFPYTLEILEYLKNKGYNLHLITNGFEQIQYGKLKNSNIDHYFNKVITSEIASSLKPNKEIFDYALEKTAAKMEESIMIGDNIEADIKGAMNAGWDAVFVNHINATVKDVQPKYIVYHLKELERIF